MDETLLRTPIPTVIAILDRRGVDFTAAAEDAVQDALPDAVRVWPDHTPRDPQAWLVAVAWRRFLDTTRADTSRRRRGMRVEDEPAPGPGAAAEDTLQLYFLCAHPFLTPASAVALTLRAVGGLSTRQIAQAYLVPEATMAQRISRAKRTVSGVRFDRPGDVATVLRVLYLVFNEGYSGDVDLAAVAGLRADASTAGETDRVQIVEWYDEFVRLTGSPATRWHGSTRGRPVGRPGRTGQGPPGPVDSSRRSPVRAPVVVSRSATSRSLVFVWELAVVRRTKACWGVILNRSMSTPFA
ncbi:sigma factor-like helix-turn-helix DNA-binding protein [Kocuria sp. CPCC 205263]|uniref:sigma factor-like helix-turn-helix DNA-binding protein n=1 Tax=Kocuria sp. CPCC 205263 TaxID=3073555 RepID=UPI0034D71743